MSKLRLGLVIIAACLVTSVSFGELFSFQSTQNQNGAKKTDASPVLSPSEFKSKVQTLRQQEQKNSMKENQSNVEDQLSQINLPNSPPAPLPQNVTLQANGTAPAQPTNKPKETTGTASPPPTETQQQQQPIPPVIAPPSPPALAQPSTPLPVAPSAPAPTAAPQQNQVYTGFGSGTQNGNTGGNSSQSGGWNVKY